jgi:hypothetical protein
MAINEEQQLGRAKNAILSFFEGRLSIPKIYLDAEWDGRRVDVLAINRDGVGDVHAVLLFLRNYFDDGQLDIVSQANAISSFLDQFSSIPAQYKYVAAVDADLHKRGAEFRVSSPLMERSFSPDGIGRVGFLTVEVPFGEEPKVRTEFSPERFRAKIAKLADEYVEQHTADWEIRA